MTQPTTLPQPTDLRGRSVLVLGLGSFGGGSGTARALANLGAKVTVSDLRGPEALPEATSDLKGLPIQWELGGHPDSIFTGQLVVVNPAIPPTAPVLKTAVGHGCTLTNEVSLALAARPELRAMAITGTHGKSTTASLASHLLTQTQIPNILAGNLGGSLFETVLDLPAETRLILELSSFQTEVLEAPVGWPEVSALTCLSQDHLDRHNTLENYWACKRRLLSKQNANSLCLLPAEGPGTDEWATTCKGEVRRLNPRTAENKNYLTASPFQEPWRVPSILAAIHGAIHLGFPENALQTALPTWPGLPHRMQQLPAPEGLHIVDNGVATHPEPTTVALQHAAQPVVLCAGGYDKGLDLKELAEAISKHCVAVHLSGPGGIRLEKELHTLNFPHTTLHPNANSAYCAGVENLPPGRTLLLSPSFSSFDEFRNFRDRAQLFQNICEKTLKTPKNGDVTRPIERTNKE